MRVVVVKLRHEPIQRQSKPCVCRFASIELLPEFPQFLSLIRRQYSEKAVCSSVLALRFIQGPGGVVEISVSRVDFDDVVYEYHLHDSRYIHRLVRVLRKQNGHDRKMPAVLRRIFGPILVNQVGSPQDGFELVDFQNKLNLPFESVCVHSRSLA